MKSKRYTFNITLNPNRNLSNCSKVYCTIFTIFMAICEIFSCIAVNLFRPPLPGLSLNVTCFCYHFLYNYWFFSKGIWWCHIDLYFLSCLHSRGGIIYHFAFNIILPSVSENCDITGNLLCLRLAFQEVYGSVTHFSVSRMEENNPFSFQFISDSLPDLAFIICQIK